MFQMFNPCVSGCLVARVSLGLAITEKLKIITRRTSLFLYGLGVLHTRKLDSSSRGTVCCVLEYQSFFRWSLNHLRNQYTYLVVSYGAESTLVPLPLGHPEALELAIHFWLVLVLFLFHLQALPTFPRHILRLLTYGHLDPGLLIVQDGDYKAQLAPYRTQPVRRNHAFCTLRHMIGTSIDEAFGAPKFWIIIQSSAYPVSYELSTIFGYIPER